MSRSVYSNGTSSSATILMILMSGLIAGPAVSFLLDVFLRVVPRAAARAHRDRNKESRHDRADQKAAERFHAGARAHQIRHTEANDDRHENRQERGHDHFLDRRAREEVHRPRVIGLGRAFHDSLDLTELSAHLDHDGARSAADRLHRHRPE